VGGIFRRHCERSEAIQKNAAAGAFLFELIWIAASGFALLAMTAGN
jgi:hypothetical protein